MKLWLLLRKPGDKLWEPWYDKAFGFVIRAEDEAGARSLAVSECGDERGAAWGPDHSTCEELSADGGEEIVMRDFASA